MSLTGKVKPYRHGFAPFAAEVYHAPYPDLYRSTAPDPAAACLSAVREIVIHHIGADQLAAIVVEPVLGEGGVIPAPVAFLRGLRALCDEHGILLVVDEIQTGFGRTGTLFACHQYGITPDLMTLAKGLGSGLPIAAVTGRAEIMDAPMVGGIGGTFGGNPVCCAAALATLDAFEGNAGAVLARARALGDTLEKALADLQKRHPSIGDARGLGAMRGLELVKDRSTKEPNPQAAAALAQYGYENGVILLTGGTHGNVVRILVPLVIEDAELAEGLAIIDEGLSRIEAQG
ncbi:Gamma-aminobutyrate:alpha-ketoglutarate aminotransferase [Minicystis rosea]|nr:Gamma-aminobutyrate:alpha-ketoglutarate aminotransferase [Minicystis rosea]